jgi:PAP2 superfamily protein
MMRAHAGLFLPDRVATPLLASTALSVIFILRGLNRSMRILFIGITACALVISLVVPALSAADREDPAPAPSPQEVQPAKAAPVGEPVEFNREYFKGFVTDFKSILASPARWDTADWVTATLVTGAAVGLYDNDAKIQKWALDHKTTTTNNIGDKVTYLGFGKYTPALLGGMYLYGYLAENGKSRKTALLSVESFVLTGVFVQTLKYTTGRHRPYTDDPPHTWDGPRRHNSGDHMSFPSGHASSAFAVATVIASEYDNPVVSTLSYGVAAITALNRVTHNAHWSSDIFVGSAIGYFTGKAVVASHKGGGESALSLAPALIDNDPGMVLTYKF